MDFDLTDEQRMLQDSLQRLLAERCGFEQRLASRDEPGGYSRALWSRHAEMGLLGLPFAEDDGGLGGGPVETLIVMQAFGRALALEPYLPTVVLSGALLRQAASPAQRDAQVGAIVAGERTLAFAYAESQSRDDLADVTARAERDGAGWRLSGIKRFVLAGDSAELLIVSARTHGDARDRDGVSLFLVDPGAAGITRRGYRTQDHQRAADIRFDAVHLEADALLGPEGAALPLIEGAVDTATAALCAEAVGAMERLHEITVEYLTMRKQFGVAIGSFQALQHRAVDMLVAVEQARSMALYAAMMCSEPDAAERGRAISAAKVQINKSARFVAQEAIQLHGGIGMTEECQAGHYFRRLSVIEMLFGDTAHHLRRVAAGGGLI
ncbi:pimeloyl-CoA dehydrogenase small subunit [Variovorax sp. WS11]|uniref:acyl-CoA dehydrogenase family protein n=1 Tax=Variovorax sp. WS11 TaxID=1105204 RepID=UPI000D0D15C3|nr:acyl-CoA dehydrogenase family protein [Variovorax sp. WS11]NDZ18660.1 pimeloyl-CoA dehydrogenase small subunit [Variovorax sp. WS11]PSL83611.1 pimeloyl-CoA dehydrogenase small subunit [Variovorax sp. WS11]